MGLLRFISPMTVPPGGKYFFEVAALRDYGIALPDGVTAKFEFPSMDGLLHQVKKYLRSNNIPVPENLTLLVTDYICRSVPLGFCYGESELGRVRFISSSQIAEGTKLIWQKARMPKGEFYVTQEEAERRAKICADCPMNLHGICTSCTSSLSDTLSRLIANRSTPYDDFLDTCALCACGLRAKVHVSLKALAQTQKWAYAKANPKCWMANTECDSEPTVIDAPEPAG